MAIDKHVNKAIDKIQYISLVNILDKNIDRIR